MLRRQGRDHRVFRLRPRRAGQVFIFHSICASEAVLLGRKLCDEVRGGSAGRLMYVGISRGE